MSEITIAVKADVTDEELDMLYDIIERSLDYAKVLIDRKRELRWKEFLEYTRTGKFE